MANYNSSYTGAQIDEGIATARAARATSGLLKSNGSGNISAAEPGTDYATPDQIPTKVSDLTNDSGFVSAAGAAAAAPVQSVNGQTGAVTVQAATDAQVSTAVNTWLGNNVAQETGYVLDRSLSLANAAAPADLVGGIDETVNGEVSRNYTIGKSLYARTGAHTIEDDPESCLSDVIPVTWGTSNVNFWYTNDTTDSARYQLWWYDENMDFLTYRGRNPAPAFTRNATPPSGAAYCQFCFKRGYAGRLTESSNNPVVIYYEAADTIVNPGLVQDVGDVSELNTDDKSSTVAAINEINSEKLESEFLMRGTNLLYHLDSIAIGATKNNMGTASAIYNTIVDKAPVSEGQTVLVSIDQIENEVQNACVTYIFKDSANENVKRSSFDKVQARNGVKLKVPTGAVKLSILLYPSISGGLTDIDAVYTNINVMLAEGQSPSINPYLSDTTYRVPPYYLANGYLEGKLNDIAECIEASGGEFDAFPFISDMHWLLNARNSPALIEYITKRFPMPRLFVGGDNDDGINVDLNNQLKRAYRGNIYVVNGNHEYMNSLVVDGVRDNTVTITGTSIWMYYHQQMTDCVVGNADRGYYYVDNMVQKMRYIILSAYTDGPTFQFEVAQKTWFASTLNSTPSGYTVVVMIHDIGSVNHSTGTLNQNRAYSDVSEVVDAYSGTVACILAGHTHFDAMGSTPGGVPIIVTTCDKMGAYGGGEAWLTAQRIAGTITEQAFDVIVIDKANKLVSAVRIGCPADNPAGSPLEKRTAYYT